MPFSGKWIVLVIIVLNKTSQTLFLGASQVSGKMYLNSSFSATSCEKLIKADEERDLFLSIRHYLATKVAADALDKEWKGNVVQINCGNNKQEFLMKQSVSTHSEVHLFLIKGEFVLQTKGKQRKGKQIGGWTVDFNLSVFNSQPDYFKKKNR